MVARSVAVVGAGVAGSALAFELARAGAKVTVYDDPDCHGAASRAAAGISAVKGQLAAHGPLFRAKLAGHAMLPAWIGEVSRAAGQKIAHRFSGLVEPIVDRASYRHVRERVFHKNFTGCYRAKFYDSKELQSIIPTLTQLCPKLRAGVLFPGDGWVDADSLLDGVRLAVERCGGHYVAEGVARFQAASAPDVWAVTSRGGRVRRFDELVVAAGVFSNELLAASGIDDLRQQACEGETLFRRLAAPHEEVVLAFGKQQLRTLGEQLVFGSSSRNQSSLSVCAPRFEAFLHSLEALPVALPPGCDDVRWGIRGRLRDRAPFAGPWSYPSARRPLWLALGFHKSGFQLAPLLASRLVPEILR